MKITLNDKETLDVIVPSATDATTEIHIKVENRNFGEPDPIAVVALKHGMVDRIDVSLDGRERAARDAEDRLELWAHLVSEHANSLATDLPLADLIAIHDREHNGPGGIRNHGHESRAANLSRLVAVISESAVENMPNAQLVLLARNVNNEAARRLSRVKP